MKVWSVKVWNLVLFGTSALVTLVTSADVPLNLFTKYWTCSTYTITVSPQKAKWILAQSEGEICFWPCLWSWVSQLCLAKWTERIKGRSGALQSALKRPGEKNNSNIPAVFFSPRCRGTVTWSNRAWQLPVSGCSHQIKTIIRMERRQKVAEGMVSDTGPSWEGEEKFYIFYSGLLELDRVCMKVRLGNLIIRCVWIIIRIIVMRQISLIWLHNVEETTSETRNYIFTYNYTCDDMLFIR